MQKLIASISKEWLLLIRDPAGLAVLFLMPMSLIFIMALIQDAPFRDYQETHIPLLFVDEDLDSLSLIIKDGLTHSEVFDLVTTIDGKPLDRQTARKLVAKGKYRMAVIIPENTTYTMQSKVDEIVYNTLSAFGIADSKTLEKAQIPDSMECLIFFDPAAKLAFKSTVLGEMQKFTSKIETQSVIKSFHRQLGGLSENPPKTTVNALDFMHFKAIDVTDKPEEKIITNSVQHNVPAWTMFAMFFIVIPMAGNMIREREEGSMLRLKTIAGAIPFVICGKILAYLFVCLLQCILMFSVGIFLIPLVGLPSLSIGQNSLAMLVVVLSASLAATGYGIMVGTIFSTHQQAATFGAVSVVILAAIGGIWIPVYVMPPFLQYLSILSPLAWGLNAFNDLFLRNGGWSDIGENVLLLLFFFFITVFIATLYRKITSHLV